MRRAKIQTFIREIPKYRLKKKKRKGAVVTTSTAVMESFHVEGFYWILMGGKLKSSSSFSRKQRTCAGGPVSE